MDSEGCEKCDTFGGKKTYANQVCMPLNGKVRCIDHCIHQIVAALNAGGVWTVACCCGHGQMVGRIDLEDGRVLFVSRTNLSPMDSQELAKALLGPPETVTAESMESPDGK